MDATRVDVKIFAKAGGHIEPKTLVSVFHGFIQQQKVSDELLFDVTTYEHCKEGPGVMLIAHEGMYGMDESKGRTGLLYSQRRAKVDGFEAALRYTLRHALSACALLEKDEALAGKLTFDSQEIMIRINDRLAAPNNAETWKAIEPAVRKVLGEAFAGDFKAEPGAEARELFTVTARTDKASSVETLLGRLAS